MAAKKPGPDDRTPEDDEAEAAWWADDADRLNRMADAARGSGEVLIITDDDEEGPELAEDGSMLNPDEEEGE